MVSTLNWMINFIKFIYESYFNNWLSSTGVHLVAARKRSQARVLLSLHCRVELSRRYEERDEVLSKWTKILTCCSMFCRFSIVADLGISSYRPGRFDTCSVIKEQMSDALILFVKEKKENSLFLMQKQTPREARNRQRAETTIDREALRFYNDRHWCLPTTRHMSIMIYLSIW